MIARVWHGWTTPDDAPAYEALLLSEILPGIAQKGIHGYHGAHVFRRDHGHEVEFVTTMWLDSLESVIAFVGRDYELAYVPEAARALLSRFDERSAHYEVLQEPT
ncbi:MAG: antibiotic biosynthesis monooxygenase [Gemmatimonadetes bacterium]|nr:antibiotic biosynthesis monooxygenase [Gemmatimonadota bacterium]NNM33136.1 antibiotic biosynthesis monooxygenase [Gemmatimonadota bacterium]